jgi:hypothetical protein
MTVTVASFRAEFPEFGSADVTPTVLVQAKLDAALLRTPSDVWGDLQDDGVKYLAAHLLALSPQAREMKLSTPDAKSPYGFQRLEYESIVASGFRVTGVTDLL